MSEETQVAARTKFQKGERRLIHRSLIKNAPYNPRKISPSNRARLRDSIKTHGLVGSLVWNELSGNLVGGHQRLEQIDELEKSKKGDYSIEVDVVQLDDAKEKALNIILNNPSVAGEWDLSLLEGVLEDLQESDLSIEETGFSTNDISVMFPNSFMLKEEAEQSEAEFPILAEFDDIKRSSAEHDAKFREDAKNQPFAKSTNGMPDVEGMDDGMEEGTSDGEVQQYTDDESGDDGPIGSLADSAPVAKPKMKMTADVDPETGEKIWTQEQRDSFGKTRKDHWKTTDDELAGDTIISLTFQKESQLKKFIELTGMDPSARYINVIEIQRIFGFELD